MQGVGAEYWAVERNWAKQATFAADWPNNFTEGMEPSHALDEFSFQRSLLREAAKLYTKDVYCKTCPEVTLASLLVF